MTARPSLPYLIRRLLLAVLVMSSLAAPAQVDRASEDSVKAGFIYNFAKFAEWPAASDEALRICALDAHPLDGHLAKLAGRMVHNREIQVIFRIQPPDWRACHVLFVSAASGERGDMALKALSGLPVLTVGEQPGFAQRDGMIELHVVDNRMRFDVNLAMVQRTGLKLSSQMLKLAARVWQ